MRGADVPIPLSLAGWLDHAQRQHPLEIELGLDRAVSVARRMHLSVPGVIVTVAGTNGKGSSCAMLESILMAAGYRTALYTSPHLMDFNERARLDGVPAADEGLAAAMEEVERARDGVSLTYFEFTTLAILRLFEHFRPDVCILEVGLGGRLDTVNLVDADCAILTCVDIDHAAWLGETREQIGLEKAHVFRAGRPAIVSDPAVPQSVVEHARAIGADLWCFGRDFNYAGDRQQWSYGGRSVRRNSLAYPSIRGANQLLNAAGVLAALEALRDRLVVPQQAVRVGLANVDLPGRFQVLPGRPSIVLDVGHNPHAASHLAENLDAMGFFGTTIAVFGAMADKDLDEIVRRLASRIDRWCVCALPTARAATPERLRESLVRVGVASEVIATFESPRLALAAAREGLGDDGRIVVFGSFFTVADVLAERRSIRPEHR